MREIGKPTRIADPLRGQSTVEMIYNWVPWFRELSEKIAEIPEGQEASLATHARDVPWGDDPCILKHDNGENADPLSFIYLVAASANEDWTPANRERVYADLRDRFDLKSDMPLKPEEVRFFPRKITANSRSGLLNNEGQADPATLWDLFRKAMEVESVSSASFEFARAFEKAFEMKHLGPMKLTRVLFLINAAEFLPFDSLALVVRHLPKNKKDWNWALYQDVIKRVRACHPDLKPAYKINARILGFDCTKSFGYTEKGLVE